MAKVSVEEARQNLIALLERVSAGEEILIHQHNKIIARLVPPENRRAWLSDLRSFRESLDVTVPSLSATVVEMRQGERF
ncbi:MAG: type II toxin-antitoxin system Phd/YefM family antitoxin [Elainellaceae cyanobacterium]